MELQGNFFPGSVLQPWNRLTSGTLVAPSLEVLCIRLDKATADRIQCWQKPFSKWEVGLGEIQRSFSASISVSLWSASLLGLWLLSWILQQASCSKGWSNSRETESGLLIFFEQQKFSPHNIIQLCPECPKFSHVPEALLSSSMGLNLDADFQCLIWQINELLPDKLPESILLQDGDSIRQIIHQGVSSRQQTPRKAPACSLAWGMGGEAETLHFCPLLSE